MFLDFFLLYVAISAGDDTSGNYTVRQLGVDGTTRAAMENTTTLCLRDFHASPEYFLTLELYNYPSTYNLPAAAVAGCPAAEADFIASLGAPLSPPSNDLIPATQTIHHRCYILVRI